MDLCRGRDLTEADTCIVLQYVGGVVEKEKLQKGGKKGTKEQQRIYIGQDYHRLGFRRRCGSVVEKLAQQLRGFEFDPLCDQRFFFSTRVPDRNEFICIQPISSRWPCRVNKHTLQSKLKTKSSIRS